MVIENQDTILQNLLHSTDLEEEFQRPILVVTSSVTALLSFIWACVYFALDEFSASLIPFLYTTITIGIFLLHKFNYYDHDSLFTIQLLLLVISPFSLSMILGGFIISSGVVIWCLVPAFLSMLLPNYTRAKYWYFGSLVLIFLNIWMTPLEGGTNSIPDNIRQIMLIANILGMSGASFIILMHFTKRKNILLEQIQVEKSKTDRLLFNVLPKEVVPYLRDGYFYVEKFDSLSILFADIVGFSGLTKSTAPESLLGILNSIYSAFDDLLIKYDAEKIRTIGDSYMVCIGAPKITKNHAVKICNLALDMMQFMTEKNYQKDGISFRVGINSGSAIAGVIGQNKFHFDIWSDDVNIASRMESHGVPGKIQISQQTYELVKDRFQCDPRGQIELKGGGVVSTFFLIQRLK